jgi:hypothetical protein
VSRRVVSYPGPEKRLEEAARELKLVGRLARRQLADERARAREAEAERLEAEPRRLRLQRVTRSEALMRAFEQDLARRLGCRVEELI